MSEPFLILHKVRGEPAFDIAERITIGEEEGWIIPTSGHRAYAVASWKLEELVDASDYPHERPADVAETLAMETPFQSVADHYSPKAEEPQPILSGLLDRLGLLPKVRRRI